MKLDILTSAYDELKIGRNFYAAQAENLGDYFFDSLFSDIDSLILYAGIYQEIFGYYRLLSHRFPYAIYYKIENDNVVIWRVLDCRQEPEKTENQLVNNEFS
jgi:plasmid stabilization system protein ParE